MFGTYWDTSDAEDSTGFGLSLTHEFSPGILVDFRYSNFRDFEMMSGGTTFDLEVDPFEFGLQFVSSEDNPLQFMGGFGLGFYQMDAHLKAGSPGFINIDDEWGFYITAGIEYTISREVIEIRNSRFTLFVEAE